MLLDKCLDVLLRLGRLYSQGSLIRTLGTEAVVESVISNLDGWMAQGADQSAAIGWALQLIARLVVVREVAVVVAESTVLPRLLVTLLAGDRAHQRMLTELIMCVTLEASVAPPAHNSGGAGTAVSSVVRRKLLEAKALSAVWQRVIDSDGADETRRCLRIMRHLVRGDGEVSKQLLDEACPLGVLVPLLARHARVDGASGGGATSACPTADARSGGVTGPDGDTCSAALCGHVKTRAQRPLHVEQETTSLILELGYAVTGDRVWSEVRLWPHAAAGLRALASCYSSDIHATQTAYTLLLHVDSSEAARRSVHRKCCATLLSALSPVELDGSGGHHSCSICLSSDGLEARSVDVGIPGAESSGGSVELHGGGVYLPCGHLFHMQCAFEWLDRSFKVWSTRPTTYDPSKSSAAQCPLCRRNPLGDVVALLRGKMDVSDDVNTVA